MSTLPRPDNPYTQDFVLYGPDGNQFNASMAQVDYFRQYGIRVAINWATQIGASVTLLLVLLLLTRREKRNSSIFIINGLCLVLNTIRSILQCVWLTSPFYEPYALLSSDFSHVTNTERGTMVVSSTITLLLVIAIMASLSFQVWVACVTASPLQKLIIMGITSVVALVAVGYRFAITVISNAQTMKDGDMTEYSPIVKHATITFAVAVWVYCAVFTCKLGHALLERKRLRMTQFGPMQIIFIMGCQTMVIPAIFTSLTFTERVPEISSQSMTIICIFLPLSAMWAGLFASDTNVASGGPDAHQRLFKDEFFRSSTASTNPYADKCHPQHGTFGNGKGRESPMGHHYHQRDSTDHGIYMQKDWHVETGEPSEPSRQV
ncbi:hypothetical protein BU23DRAFT_160788 [Bimuria novae-zelandiae CBS 107.79]|uniref:Mating-type alpha-pheromone receptor PreB n=1 Tax=Bimuria novae-zelandiae CBS 107.79 TaxID=1447943 RepID=A0A6A5V675_9PLEO|nr:hypothetical protein BU23DRAFT_160788 [Bimuria novae-zelandiae CBS 107.79]